MRTEIYGALLAIGGRGLQVLISFLSVPLIIGALGADKMGAWRLVLSLLGVFTLIQAGFVPILKNGLANAYSDKDEIEFQRLACIGFKLSQYSGLMCAVVGSICICLGLDANLFPAGSLEPSEHRLLLAAIVVIGSSQVYTGFAPTIYEARLEHAMPRIAEICAIIFGFILLLVALRMGSGLAALCVASFAPTIISKLILAYPLKDSSQNGVSIKKEEYLGLLRPSVASFCIQALAVMLNIAPNLIVASHLGLEVIARFSLTYQLCSVPVLIISAVTPVLWPSFTFIIRQKNNKSLKVLLIKSAALSVLISVLWAAFMCAFGADILMMWSKKNIVVPEREIALLASLVAVQAVTTWMGALMWSIGKLKLQITCYSIALIVSMYPELTGIRLTSLSDYIINLLIAHTVGLMLPFAWATVLTAKANACK